MDKTTFRILDTLARGIGRPISINDLTGKIARRYGGAYYANVYKKLLSLNKEGIVNITKVGNSSVTSLNFKNYFMVDLLTEMELKKKQEFLGNRTEGQMLFLDLDNYCSDLPFIKSISLIYPERNARLNRAELLILIKTQDSGTRDTLDKIFTSLQRIHNTKIDYLILTKDAFLELLKSDETNSLKEMLSNQITILFPQAFWAEIRSILEKGIQFAFSDAETNPAKIPEQDIAYNLARFGYKEIGPKVEQGEKISIEYITASILMKDDARRKNAIPIILAKSKANYALLIFLAQKYGLSGKLLGLMKALKKIKPVAELHEAIRTLEAMDVKETKADEKAIKAKMRLYNEIR